MTEKSIALFDFDGTITYKDSMLEFVKYAVGKHRYYLGLMYLLPHLLLFKIGLIKNEKAKMIFLSYFFKGWTQDKLISLGEEYALRRLDKIIRQDAMNKIRWHKEQKHEVVIVTASASLWLEVWCKKNFIQLIASQLEFKNNLFTGCLVGKNCNGQEKVKQIQLIYHLDSYSEIYAYGDSKGDYPMLSLANQNYYRYFNNKNH